MWLSKEGQLVSVWSNVMHREKELEDVHQKSSVAVWMLQQFWRFNVPYEYFKSLLNLDNCVSCGFGVSGDNFFLDTYLLWELENRDTLQQDLLLCRKGRRLRPFQTVFYFIKLYILISTKENIFNCLANSDFEVFLRKIFHLSFCIT